MPLIKISCPSCGKTAETKSTFNIGGKSVALLHCGHMLSADKLNHSSPEQIRSLDGKSLFKYQCGGVRIFEGAGGRALCADAMGVGKTIQALATVLLHQEEMLRFLCVTKGSLTIQWQHEALRWMGREHFAQIISGSKDFWIPGLSGYIITYDLLPRILADCQKKVQQENGRLPQEDRMGTWDMNKLGHERFEAIFKDLGIKTVILDECQQIKNTDAARTKATRALCTSIPNVLALSGTPIKNNAAEYFPVLNIIKPEMFPIYSKFLQHHCQMHSNGYGIKVGGLRDPVGFKEKTKDFIFRREREDVLPDLPLIQRTFQFSELGPEVEQEYINTFKEFRDEFNSPEDLAAFERGTRQLAYLTKMRHLTGLSKINPCMEFLMDFLADTEEKICVFVHHKDVAQILHDKLTKVLHALKLAAPLQITSAMSAEERFAAVTEFTKSALRRVFIISTLAGGEGLNLQVCSRFIMLERQWNPANEEQAEARFPRPGQQAQSILGTYFVATGTVDEMFAEIVEKKRSIVNSSLRGEVAEPWDQSSIMKELMEMLASSGGKKWSI